MMDRTQLLIIFLIVAIVGVGCFAATRGCKCGAHAKMLMGDGNLGCCFCEGQKWYWKGNMTAPQCTRIWGGKTTHKKDCLVGKHCG